MTPYDGPEREPTGGRTAHGHAGRARWWVRHQHRRRAGTAPHEDRHGNAEPVGRTGARHRPRRARVTSRRPTSCGRREACSTSVGDQADLAPVDIDAFVVVHGGVFVLAEGELWFTDLARLRGTGQTDVTGVQVNADGSLLKVVDNRGGTQEMQGYDTRTGKAVRGDGRHPDARAEASGSGPLRGDDLSRRDAVGRRGRHRRPGAAHGGSAPLPAGGLGRGLGLLRRRHGRGGWVPPHRPLRHHGQVVPPARSGGLQARSSSVPAGRRVLRGIAACPG